MPPHLAMHPMQQICDEQFSQFLRLIAIALEIGQWIIRIATHGVGFNW
jgi:hypothetical protein